jgi:hypothetical protein
VKTERAATTARAYDLVVLTPDQRIARYPEVKTLW